MKNLFLRNIISISSAIFIAVFINHYFSFSEQGWSVIIAFFVSPFIHDTLYKKLFFLSIFLVILLSAIFSSINIIDSLNKQIIDMLIGVAIGIVCTKWIFPLRFGSAFGQGIIPVLRALVDYSTMTTTCFVQLNINNNDEISKKKIEIENLLSSTKSIYPEWAYDVGFNPGLRGGFRFFLIHLEQIIELFFSMEYLLKQIAEVKCTQAMTNSVRDVMEKNNRLMHVIINYFQHHELKEEVDTDFFSDISTLENFTRCMVPKQLELLDISPDYVALTAFVRDMKDIRELLLKLVMALPPLSGVVG